jgi:hypothetical protein
MTTAHTADRALAGIGAVTCLGSLFLRWKHNEISGTKTGFDLLQSSSESRPLTFFLAGIAGATVATLIRFPPLAIVGSVAAAFFLMWESAAIHSNVTRAFGQDALGRFTEFEETSTLSAGFYIAIAAIVIIGCGALVSAVQRYRP